MAKRRYNRKRKKRTTKGPVILILLAALAAGVSITSIHRFETHKPVVVIAGTDVSALSSEEATDLLTKNHPWKLTLQYENKSYTVDNYMEDQIQSVVEQAYKDLDTLEDEKTSLSLFQKLVRGLQGKKADTLEYDLKLTDTEELAHSIAEKIDKDWSVPAKNSTITKYDTTNGVFEYSDGQEGIEIDADQLALDLQDAFDHETYDTTISVLASRVTPEIRQTDYKNMGTYTTNTTANEDRNTNVRLACEAISGFILEPGEQFSFNDVVGERTPEKGYKEAAAYSMDEVVQEYGGGVCQVSSTLYNAVIAAGLQTDVRTGHVYKPSYVTPGQDATVSFQEPDFAFTNSSDAPVGIKATYWNQTVCVEIYGVPVLEEGVVRYLRSEKKSDLDPPSPTYVEDTSLPYGEEVTSTPAESGSEWTTDIVTEKDGQVVETTFLHTTRYKGKAAVIKRNTTKKDDEDEDEDSDKKDKKDKTNKKDKTEKTTEKKKSSESEDTTTEKPTETTEPPAETTEAATEEGE
ncbi:MAG: VanW family protein [Lachnospiraceae bacterium]|nr:VanW family protein [Lachnospiraceae bacterium]